VDIYGINKAAMEQTTEMLSKVHDFKYTIIRPHNVMGPRQSLRDPYRNVIGIFMNRIMRREPLYIYGSGEQQRAFSYIDDSLPCYVKCIDKADGEIINIGGIRPVTINKLADLVLAAMGESPTLYPREHLQDRHGEVKVAWCTYQKSEKLLGYRENVGMQEGINIMAQWALKQGAQEWGSEKLSLWNEKAPAIWK
jgi:UDP-glucose 4-epimerase